MKSITVRPVQSSEIDLLQKIAIETFTSAFASFNTKENMEIYLHEAFNIDRLKGAFYHLQTQFLFAVDDSEVLGYLKINEGIAQSEQLFDQSLEIERIYVLQKCFGKGVGKALLDYAFHYARAQKLKTIWLGVWEHNPRALRFYEKNGFQVFSSHPFMMGTDEQYDLLMRFDF